MDALMLRRGKTFYFTPEAAKFFNHRVRQMPGVSVTWCRRPWFHKYRLEWLAGVEVYWH